MLAIYSNDPAPGWWTNTKTLPSELRDYSNFFPPGTSTQRINYAHGILQIAKLMQN